MTLLSPAERSYLRDSLNSTPIIRPDSRSPHQFRPIEAKTSFLASSNGSARIRLIDGSECIVSVKAKVVDLSTVANNSLIEVDIDVDSFRDDSNFVTNLKFHILNSLNKIPDINKVLKLTTKYGYKLFIDVIVTTHHSSYPLTLISLATYLALKTTRLPKLISEVNDEEIAEQPTFSDDWAQATLIEELLDTKFQPPILLTLGIIGNNIIFDPSIEEEQIIDNSLIMGVYNGKVITPINTVTSSSSEQTKGINSIVLIKAIELGNKYGGMVVNALDTLIEQDIDDENIF
ncbi:Exosome complex component [Spathaspora sp. JA1]|nr:Exosome complex component [Spathaspora sp. JA1]